MPARAPLPARLALAVAALALALGAVEGALRLLWPDLPSLAPMAGVQALPAGALPDDELDRRTCRLPPGGELHHTPWQARYAAPGGGEGPPLRLWVAGDSVAMGAGVAQDETFAAGLARALAADRDRPVALLDLGIQGAAYCNTVQDLHLYLDRACPGADCPDAVVLQLFADDLEQRNLYAARGQVIAFPWRERDPALRWAASHSYLGNLAWSQWRARAGGPVPERGIAEADQQQFRGAIGALVDRLDALGVARVVALLPPAGLPWCDDPAFAARVSDCAWMTQDLDLLAVMLVQEELPWVDLRAIWHGAPDHTLAQERHELATRGRLPVHPDAAGHARLAQALWPPLQAALAGR